MRRSSPMYALPVHMVLHTFDGSNALKHRFVVCVNKQVNNCVPRDTKELAQRCITTSSFENTIHRCVYASFTSYDRNSRISASIIDRRLTFNTVEFVYHLLELVIFFFF